MKNQILSLAIFVIGQVTLHAQIQEREIVFFDYNQADLSADSQDKLDNFILGLNKPNVESVKIIGHTDSDGSIRYNEELSENRALKVQKR